MVIQPPPATFRNLTARRWDRVCSLLPPSSGSPNASFYHRVRFIPQDQNLTLVYNPERILDRVDYQTVKIVSVCDQLRDVLDKVNNVLENYSKNLYIGDAVSLAQVDIVNTFYEGEDTGNFPTGYDGEAIARQLLERLNDDATNHGGDELGVCFFHEANKVIADSKEKNANVEKVLLELICVYKMRRRQFNTKTGPFSSSVPSPTSTAVTAESIQSDNSSPVDGLPKGRDEKKPGKRKKRTRVASLEPIVPLSPSKGQKGQSYDGDGLRRSIRDRKEPVVGNIASFSGKTHPPLF